MDGYFCAALSLRCNRSAAGDTVNELLFPCLTFEMKVKPGQANYNIGRTNKQVFEYRKDGRFP